MELKVGGYDHSVPLSLHLWNPFNGIERHRTYTLWQAYLLIQNPFNGIESRLEVVDFNKTHAKESIQWN